ncbi:MAG: bifunctional 3-deoxy-7-phosphoheptulonate synthase/chorismate mutase type II [Crocinitomicaceae bacterium]|nr:bifunctional 3-deoxy-7-phosphoheptulonate synthase/chorismate mutase type II [Crocinitomicaceae bacterium]
MILLKDIERPIIISGPCSAETEEQVHETARRLKETGKVHVLRAGIWKPRTRPNAFEGIGEPGLKWLMDASIATGIPAITEVANANHTQLALKAGFRKLWIGARTTVNPFTVQEIAESVKGEKDLEILVKNPVNPDLNLWIGGIERFMQMGIENVHAVHRGFSSFKSKKYRNEPMWEIPIALKGEFPNMKLLCDPSHICGNRTLLAEVSQKAIDLIYDGLMIETHISPDEAWSDAQQQITPEQLSKLLSDLIIRKEYSADADFKKNLEVLRIEINSIDQDLLNLLIKRMQVVQQIGKYKGENQITILQPQRWEDIKATHIVLAREAGLSDAFIEKYLEAIHLESIRLQTRVMNDK